MTRAAGGSAQDPMDFGRVAFFEMTATAGRTISTPALTPGENTGVLLLAGQSNIANAINGTHTLVNPTKVDNLNVYDGGVYRAADPLLGCSGNGGNIATRIGDKLVTAGIFDRVILVPVGVSGTEVAQWVPGALLYPKIIGALRRLAAVNLPLTAVLWMQGETDGYLGTSQANYAARLSSIISGVRATGEDAPWFIGKCTYNGGSVSSAVQAAQASVVNGVNIFAGADTDSLTGTTVNRDAVDNTHLTPAGANTGSDLWTTALDAVF